MAEKKMTQAQRTSAAQNGSRSRSASKKSTGNSTGKENNKVSRKDLFPDGMEPAPRKFHREPNPNSRWISAAVYLLLFFVFLVIALHQKGFVLRAVQSVSFGLFGPVAFYLAIPAMLFLFVIHAFYGDQPTLMRTACTWGSIFFTGCISHLTMHPRLDTGFALVSSLYATGVAGESGGVICGLVAELLYKAFGMVLSMIVLILAAVICLMAAFRLTIPSLIRAFQERPRFDEDEEAPQERPDPAAVLVNSMAVKQHEMKKKQQQQRLERAQNPKPDAPMFQPPWRRQEQPAATGPNDEARAQEILRQIADAAPEEPEIPVEIPTEIPAVQKPVAPVSNPSPAQEVLDFGCDPVPVPEPTAPMQEEPDFFPEQPMHLPEEPDLDFEPSFTQQEEPEPEEPFSIVPPAPVIPARPVIPASPLERTGEDQPKSAAPVSSAVQAEPANKKVTAKEAAASALEVTQEIEQNRNSSAPEKPVYTFPSIELLKMPSGGSADGTAEMRENTRRLNDTLSSFKIDAHVTNVTRGPSVTRYEVELEQGVRLSKLTSAADDIALSLGTSGVRIAPVPNKISVVGIEVPNQAVTMVSLREVVDSNAFRQAKSSASFAVGKDISGAAIVGNITKLPHMLIAGTTGSGKSVCMNSIILSLLYKASPEDVRLIMVDPKMVELGIYNGIPHLLIPVVTDPKKAAGSLQWAVTEMMRRYRMMSEAGVRDLESYNELIDSGNLEGEHMAQVVVIIDELADLMLVAAKEVEESICRIAQMGRASGIHLIIATQRPSADVITGLMKANIPSRIAFAVASAMESRIILDNSGAEKLVGKGDMLYAPIGCGKPVRVQGCFVSDGEVEAVATYVKQHYDNTYDEKVLHEIEQNAAKSGSSKSSGGSAEVEANAEEQAFDEMLIPAVDAVLQAQQASVSMLQRKLKLGFSRAARIVDTMEELGIVGEHAGSKPRQILVTPDQWAQMKISLTGGKAPSALGGSNPEESSEPVPDLID